ncbi:NADH-quinone oxidoreductase subunit H [Candidatus Woesearchaeota archaeon]|nr:NADH-quinone oxidoreductase subunit H [Candidatus Woesearchaeota archaeon]
MNELLIYSVLNILAVILISPFFMGVIKKIKAWCQGREGQPLLQQYYNLIKLLRKESVVSSTSSWITRATPYVNVAALITAALFVPVLFVPSGSTLFGNLILMLYLLALAKFFMALAGLDAGSTFGGMGSSREMAFSAILEPVIIIIFLALAFMFKTPNLFEIFRQASAVGILYAKPLLILLMVSLFIVLIAETSRVPVDNPETHLELTMIHAGMVLEQSGKYLGMMELSHAMKQTLLMAVLINILVPIGFSTALSFYSIAISFAAFMAKGTALAAVIGIFESSIAKLRLFRLPVMFMVAFFLAFLTIILEVYG